MGTWLLVIALTVALMSLSRSPAPTAGEIVGTMGTATAPTPVDAPRAPLSAVIAKDAKPSAPTAAELTVSLTADQPCWITASTDGNRVLYRLMDAGTTEALRARRTITLRVGNAGGVKWSVNGQPATVMGRPGEVRTVKVSADDR